MNKVFIAGSAGVILAASILLISGAVFTQHPATVGGYDELRAKQDRLERLQQRKYELMRRKHELELIIAEEKFRASDNEDSPSPVTTEPREAEVDDRPSTVESVETASPAEPEVTKPPTTQTPDTVEERTNSPESVLEEVVPEVPADDDSYLSAIAAEIHRLTNNERGQAGENKLTFSATLSEIATQHSQDMSEQNYFSHTDPHGCNAGCRLDDANYDYSYWGENIAWRSSSQLPEAEELAAYFVENWMDSSGHRRNILSDNFTHEGIGLAQVGNKVYVTVTFARPK